MTSKSEESDSISSIHEDLGNEDLRFEHFYAQIKSVPHLIEKAVGVDQALLTRLNEIQKTASSLIDQFDSRKEELLKKVDAWLFPIAKEALDKMSYDAKVLREHLQESLQNLQMMEKMDWIEHAKSWACLYTKCYDNKELTQKILKMASDRTSYLIDKDIKVICDYQNQSLAHISQETDEFKNIKARLKTVTEGSLKALLNLKKSPEGLSFTQTVDWIARIHKERENHFDQSLMKIDSVMKDVVRPEVLHHDAGHFAEFENEVVFMEHELRHIHDLISKLDLKDEKDVSFIEMRLEGLKEHLEQFDLSQLPDELKIRVKKIHQDIQEAYFRLE
jgi:hypothetical protein